LITKARPVLHYLFGELSRRNTSVIFPKEYTLTKIFLDSWLPTLIESTDRTVDSYNQGAELCNKWRDGAITSEDTGVLSIPLNDCSTAPDGYVHLLCWIYFSWATGGRLSRSGYALVLPEKLWEDMDYDPWSINPPFEHSKAFEHWEDHEYSANLVSTRFSDDKKTAYQQAPFFENILRAIRNNNHPIMIPAGSPQDVYRYLVLNTPREQRNQLRIWSGPFAVKPEYQQWFHLGRANETQSSILDSNNKAVTRYRPSLLKPNIELKIEQGHGFWEHILPSVLQEDSESHKTCTKSMISRTDSLIKAQSETSRKSSLIHQLYRKHIKLSSKMVVALIGIFLSILITGWILNLDSEPKVSIRPLFSELRKDITELKPSDSIIFLEQVNSLLASNEFSFKENDELSAFLRLIRQLNIQMAEISNQDDQNSIEAGLILADKFGRLLHIHLLSGFNGQNWITDLQQKQLNLIDRQLNPDLREQLLIRVYYFYKNHPTISYPERLEQLKNELNRDTQTASWNNLQTHWEAELAANRLINTQTFEKELNRFLEIGPMPEKLKARFENLKETVLMRVEENARNRLHQAYARYKAQANKEMLLILEDESDKYLTSIRQITMPVSRLKILDIRSFIDDIRNLRMTFQVQEDLIVGVMGNKNDFILKKSNECLAVEEITISLTPSICIISRTSNQIVNKLYDFMSSKKQIELLITADLVTKGSAEVNGHLIKAKITWPILNQYLREQ